MHIVQIASEFTPIAKVGGLGDVVQGLCNELVRLGHEVELILPKYDCLHQEALQDLNIEVEELYTTDGTHQYKNRIWSARVDAVKILLIEPDHKERYFNRGMIYGCHDDIDRFIYFSNAAITYLLKSEKKVDVVHLHDWPTALAAVLCKQMYPLPTVLTIHNMEHQGKCQPFNLARVGLDAQAYLHPKKMQDPYMPELINLLKGGIVYADHVTTVSPTYKREVQTVTGGFGLHELLIEYDAKFTGILNGIDEIYWNPAKDPHLFKRYDTHQVHTEAELNTVLEGKMENKSQLYKQLHLKERDKPLIACVTRLATQKAPHLLKHALARALEKEAQFILLGTAANALIAKEFQQLAKELAHHPDARILLNKDEALAHLIFAAADMFIIPSLFEPCGLTQLIALRYGTIPLARRTGGLNDTVFDVDTSAKEPHERNGFTFDFADEQGVDWALDRALACYKEDQKKWRALLLNGMHQDFSWKKAAKEYVKIYERCEAKPRARII